MNTALVIIGLSMLIFLVVFYLKRAKEKRKAWLEEREKIKEYGEKINEETREKNKYFGKVDCFIAVQSDQSVVFARLGNKYK